MRPVAGLELLDEDALGGAGKEGNAEEVADDPVEVDALPNADGLAKSEEDEGHHREGQGDLSHEPAHKVIVALVGSRLAPVRSEEERAYITAEVCALSVREINARVG